MIESAMQFPHLRLRSAHEFDADFIILAERLDFLDILDRVFGLVCIAVAGQERPTPAGDQVGGAALCQRLQGRVRLRRGDRDHGLAADRADRRAYERARMKVALWPGAIAAALVTMLAIALKPRAVVCAAVCPGYVRTKLGGAAAPLRVGESITGLRQVIAGLTLARTGSFTRYNGETIAW